MSRYQGFYDEQPFQKATFSIDSPERRPKHDSNRVEKPKQSLPNNSLHAYFKDDHTHSPDIKHREGEHIERAMHHQEIRLRSIN